MKFTCFTTLTGLHSVMGLRSLNQAAHNVPLSREFTAQA